MVAISRELTIRWRREVEAEVEERGGGGGGGIGEAENFSVL